MWRKDTFPGCHDSDQSISEEDDGRQGNCVSLGSCSTTKDARQIISQLEILTEAAQQPDHELTPAKFSQKKPTANFCNRVEVKKPSFNNEEDFMRFPGMSSRCNSDAEIISDDEEVNMLTTKSTNLGSNKSAFASVNKDGACTWLSATREAEALVQLNENVGTGYHSSRAISVKANRSFKGDQVKVRSKFSIHFRSQKEDLPLSICSQDEIESPQEAFPFPLELEHGKLDHSDVEHLEVCGGGKREKLEIHEIPAEMEPGNVHSSHSMAELLDCFQEKKMPKQGISNMYGRKTRKRMQLAMKKSKFTLGNRNMEDINLPEALDSGPSSENEDASQDLQLVIPETKQKTLTDQFQEAFDATSMNDDRPLFVLPEQKRTGLFGKLEKIMRIDKEREVNFLKGLQRAATSNDEANCLCVRILSRHLEAKLIVCQCSLSTYEENDQRVKDKESGDRTTTIIFNSRTCTDVELELGNFIKIHPPWKEVNVGKDEVMILSTYFSQIPRSETSGCFRPPPSI